VGLESCKKWMVPLAFAALLVGGGRADAGEYYDHASMTDRLVALGEREPNLVRVRELARSREDRKVWMVEVGAGSDEQRSVRPAMLVVAGIEGNDLVGSFTTVAWIERLVERYPSDSAVAGLLKTTTVYVVPCLNPDAAEHFFATPQIERSVNGTPHDEDHDGLIDEDGCEDLNGDGLITMMRVEDREGQYILDPNESRLLLKADPLRGEIPAGGC
jgi:hypothetical protein